MGLAQLSPARILGDKGSLRSHLLRVGVFWSRDNLEKASPMNDLHDGEISIRRYSWLGNRDRLAHGSSSPFYHGASPYSNNTVLGLWPLNPMPKVVTSESIWEITWLLIQVNATQSAWEGVLESIIAGGISLVRDDLYFAFLVLNNLNIVTGYLTKPCHSL